MVTAGVLGFVLAIILEKRIHRWAARVTAGSGWRAFGLLAAYVGAVVVMGVLLGIGIPLLRLAGSWAVDAAVLSLIVAVLTITVPFMSPAGQPGMGQLTVAGDIERAGGTGIAPKVLGCGGALVAFAVGIGAAMGLGMVFLLE